jgi:hypothetical protein
MPYAKVTNQAAENEVLHIVGGNWITTYSTMDGELT